MNTEQLEKMRSGRGFIAALDQSGGSTPKALAHYGIGEDQYSNDEEMFAVMHAMRSRIMEAPSFTGDHILGAILFEDTMSRTVQGRDSVSYLWDVKQIVPFLKIDKGLEAEQDGVQIMKPMPQLAALLSRASEKSVFGTKERSFIKAANPKGITAIVEQQFEVANQVLGAGLVPILEPEVDIHSPDKREAEELLKADILAGLHGLGDDQHVMLKLTLPEVDDFYAEFVNHPRVLRVVALSGGYSRQEADAKLARNHGVIASFSRALMDGLSAGQSDDEFDATLREAVEEIFAASTT